MGVHGPNRGAVAVDAVAVPEVVVLDAVAAERASAVDRALLADGAAAIGTAGALRHALVEDRQRARVCAGGYVCGEGGERGREEWMGLRARL